MKKFIVWCGMIVLSLHLTAQPVSMNDGWRFSRNEAVGADAISITLPHTWNAIDGQDGKGDYFRGIGWYTHDFRLEKEEKGTELYLRFGAVNQSMELFLNGRKVGEHVGGYTACTFNITPFVRLGAVNHIQVKASNDESLEVCPLSADFTFFGGIVRGVELIRKNPIHIACDYSGSQGVFLSQQITSAEKAEVTAKAKIRNASGRQKKVTVRFEIKDAVGNLIQEKEELSSVAPHALVDVSQKFTMLNPRLWNGKEDPYLYRVETSVFENKKETDRVVQPLGLRYYSIDPDKGFFLNGKPYPLRGCSMHEERKNKGNAVTDRDRKEDVDMLVDMGCNYIRLSHYQHGDFTYNYLDSLGIICWTEIPLIDRILDTEAFSRNCKNLMRSLIRQQYNHPCVVVWGVSNEINYRKGPNPVGLIKELNALVHKEDPGRLSTLAAMFSEKETNFIPDVYSNNRYDGWYYNKVEDIADFVDKLHGSYPKSSIGISEYGVGAHPYQHEEGIRKPQEGGQWHPEGFQCHFHEFYWQTIKARPFLWSTSIWAAFDFASDRRNEGCQPGINDKGLITHDRQIKKDAYYFYKANWNKAPMVYLCARRLLKRNASPTVVKIYSNCDEISLLVNGRKVPVQRGENCIHLSEPIALDIGENRVTATAVEAGIEYTDCVNWQYIP